jgi:hypothetical protein
MENTELKVDKSAWGEGPWQSEPDRLEWKDEKTGLPCLIVRTGNGHLCGYVAVPPGHPLHGLGYDACYDKADINVHGGLTYAEACQGKICHVPEPGEPDNVWWIGFDCAHSGDLSPGPRALLRQRGLPIASYEWNDQYRTVEYVKQECKKLASQVMNAPR